MFEHATLEDAEKQIRLLRLGPGTGSDVIELSIETYYLETAPDYFAISYAWGEESVPAHVLVNGSRLSVRWNCWYALSQARHHYPASRIWIDSICIDQSALNEKSAQVAIMFDIFAAATNVLVCVGPHANESQALIESFKDAAVPFLVVEGTVWTSAWTSAWTHFSQRDYWTRLWIVQEIAAGDRHGKNAVQILCGHSRVLWRKIVASVTQGLDHDNLKDTVENIPLISGVCAGPIELVDVFKNFGYFECSNVLDRLYSLLKLVGPPSTVQSIRPDYTKSTWDLALDLCPFLHHHHMAYAMRTLKLGLSDGHVQTALRERCMIHTSNVESSSQAEYLGHGRLVSVNENEGMCFVERIRMDASGRLTIEDCTLTRYALPGDDRYMEELITLLKSDRNIAVSRGPPQPLFNSSRDQSPVAWVFAGARAGDSLFYNPLYTPFPGSCNSLLVARPSDVEPRAYQVVGYGVGCVSRIADTSSVTLIIPRIDALLFASMSNLNRPKQAANDRHLEWSSYAALAQSLWWSPFAGSILRVRQTTDKNLDLPATDSDLVTLQKGRHQTTLAVS